MALDSSGILVPTGTSDTAFYNANRDQPVDAHVPELMATTQGIVTSALTLNQTFAQSAITSANAAIAALKDATFPPALPAPPDAPTIVTSFTAGASLGFDVAPSWGALPQDVVETFFATPVTLPDISSQIPDYVPLVTGLAIPTAPSLNLPAVPDAPALDTTFAVPDAPLASYGAAPDLDGITLPTYAPPVLPVFGDAAPTFAVLPPSPFIAWTEPVYVSDIKSRVEGVLVELLAGGTGLPPDVERALWERARQREDVLAFKSFDEAYDALAVRGFAHPDGQLNAQILAVQEESARKGTELSRDIAIKQADLEQHNREFAVEHALDYERIFTAVFLAVVERNFQIAKFHVETAIQIFNLQVTAFNVEQAVFGQKIVLYRAQLEAVFAYLKGFEALVEIEKAKSGLNLARVQAFQAKVQAFGEQVNAYRALVEAARGKADLQGKKVDIFRAQIDAMVGRINGERAKFEAYDSQVKGETAKVGLEEANARSYQARVQGVATKAEILIKVADAQIATNDQTLKWNIANMQRVTANNSAQLNLVQANLAAFTALTSRAVAKYGADKEARSVELQANVSLSQVAIAKYTALLEQWRVRATEVIQFATINGESLRAAAQAAATLASGAMAGTHVSAGISAGASAGQTNSRSSTDTTSQARNVNEQSVYEVIHNYQHRT